MAKGATKDKVMAAATKTVNVVECSECGAMHLVDRTDYVVVYGNVSVGMEIPIIDGNIDDKGRVSGSRVYCRKSECLQGLFSEMRGVSLSLVEGGTRHE